MKHTTLEHLKDLITQELINVVDYEDYSLDDIVELCLDEGEYWEDKKNSTFEYTVPSFYLSTGEDLQIELEWSNEEESELFQYFLGFS